MRQEQKKKNKKFDKILARKSRKFQMSHILNASNGIKRGGGEKKKNSHHSDPIDMGTCYFFLATF